MADVLAEHGTRITRLEIWKNGNGLPGAASTIQCHEKRLDDIETHHAKEPQLLQQAVSKALTERSKSKEGIIRAWGPYFAAIVVIITTLLEKLL